MQKQSLKLTVWQGTIDGFLLTVEVIKRQFFNGRNEKPHRMAFYQEIQLIKLTQITINGPLPLTESHFKSDILVIHWCSRVPLVFLYRGQELNYNSQEKLGSQLL